MNQKVSKEQLKDIKKKYRTGLKAGFAKSYLRNQITSEYGLSLGYVKGLTSSIKSVPKIKQI